MCPNLKAAVHSSRVCANFTPYNKVKYAVSIWVSVLYLCNNCLFISKLVSEVEGKVIGMWD